MLLYAVWAAFSAMRVFALSNRDWRPTLFTLALGWVPVGINIYYCVASVFHVTTIPILCSLCESANTFSAAVGDRLVVGSRSCLFASDFIVLLFTAPWYFVYDMESKRVLIPKDSLIHLMLKHGFIYFVVLAALNALHMGLWLEHRCS